MLNPCLLSCFDGRSVTQRHRTLGAIGTVYCHLACVEIARHLVGLLVKGVLLLELSHAKNRECNNAGITRPA